MYERVVGVVAIDCVCIMLPAFFYASPRAGDLFVRLMLYIGWDRLHLRASS